MYLQALDNLLGTMILTLPTSESVQVPSPKPHLSMRNLLQPSRQKVTARLLPESVLPPTAVVVHAVKPKTTLSIHHVKQSQLSETLSSLHVATNSVSKCSNPAQQHTGLSSTTQLSPNSLSVPVTTLLHHDGDTVFATQTAPSTTSSEENLLNVPDPERVFLEYNLQQCEKRLENARLEKLFITEKERRALKYKKNKEEREERCLLALNSIGVATKKLRTGLLKI